MITAIIAILEHIVQSDINGWVYVLTVFLDLSIISAVDRLFKQKDGV